MKHIILGTAGHVDHGKTSLVRYITGVNTDSLKEEAERGITIELGFAPFVLPDGQRIGIVDVPGHERFIKNMLAGATGIDLVLFVIAADEGVMPQTREHMDILRLLGVTRGIVVLTKVDMVDEEWLALVREDVCEYLKDSPLHDAPLLNVSSKTGEGVPELISAIAAASAEVTERTSSGICRLAVDRVFTMSGFGTIVTGTLWCGSINQGDTLELLPSLSQVRVRSLQVHGEKRSTVYAGERVAVNLTGVEKQVVERGSWLITPGAVHGSTRINIRLELLPDAPELSQRTRVHVHHGTVEALARVVLLDRKTLSPGSGCFAQLELESPLTALQGDRLILRFYSPMFTIGGGTVLDTEALKPKRRFAERELERLDALHSGDPGQIVLASMQKDACLWQAAQIAACLQIGEQCALELAHDMVINENLLSMQNGYFFPLKAAHELCTELSSWLEAYFSRFPMRFGVSKMEVAVTHFPKMEQKQQRAIFQYLGETGSFEQDETMIWPVDWQPKITPAQNLMIDRVREFYKSASFSPAPWTEAAATLGIPEKEQGEYLQWFLRSGELIRIADNIVYMRDTLAEAEKILRSHSADGSFSLAEARDMLGTPRKTVQQICEYFDRVKLTRRDGERRYWNS